MISGVTNYVILLKRVVAVTFVLLLAKHLTNWKNLNFVIGIVLMFFNSEIFLLYFL